MGQLARFVSPNIPEGSDSPEIINITGSDQLTANEWKVIQATMIHAANNLDKTPPANDDDKEKSKVNSRYRRAMSKKKATIEAWIKKGVIAKGGGGGGGILDKDIDELSSSDSDNSSSDESN